MKVPTINRTDRGEPINESSWPRNTVKSVETRKRDVVIRLADWTRDRDEPAYDVEVYIHGVYDWNESQSFTTRNGGRTKPQARAEAVAFAQAQIEKFTK